MEEFVHGSVICCCVLGKIFRCSIHPPILMLENMLTALAGIAVVAETSSDGAGRASNGSKLYAMINDSVYNTLLSNHVLCFCILCQC
jgi:hypothetical protein